MPTTEQQTDLAALIGAHEGYLKQLQLQAATLGINAPPHIATEIHRVGAELAQLKQAAAISVSDEIVEQLGPTGRYQLWMAHIMRLDADIGRIADQVQKLHDKFDQVLIALATRGAVGL